MFKLRTLGAVVILFAAVATPVFAQDAIGLGYDLKPQLVSDNRSSYGVPDDQNFRGAFDESDRMFYDRPLSNKERDNLEDFGTTGRDPSMVGDEDPYLHPGG